MQCCKKHIFHFQIEPYYNPLSHYRYCYFCSHSNVFLLYVQVCFCKSSHCYRVSCRLKALANDDTLLRTHCCSWCFLGAQTRGTQNECCVSMLRKLGNICCGHKMFLNKIRNIFSVPDRKFVSATNVARADKRGNICVGNNVSVTMCPRLPEP